MTDGDAKADAGASITPMPLTVPMLTGPAAISTTVIYAQRTRHWWELAALHIPQRRENTVDEPGPRF